MPTRQGHTTHTHTHIHTHTHTQHTHHTKHTQAQQPWPPMQRYSTTQFKWQSLWDTHSQRAKFIVLRVLCNLVSSPPINEVNSCKKTHTAFHYCMNSMHMSTTCMWWTHAHALCVYCVCTAAHIAGISIHMRLRNKFVMALVTIRKHAHCYNSKTC